MPINMPVFVLLCVGTSGKPSSHPLLEQHGLGKGSTAGLCICCLPPGDQAQKSLPECEKCRGTEASGCWVSQQATATVPGRAGAVLTSPPPRPSAPLALGHSQPPPPAVPGLQLRMPPRGGQLFQRGWLSNPSKAQQEFCPQAAFQRLWFLSCFEFLATLGSPS